MNLREQPTAIKSFIFFGAIIIGFGMIGSFGEAISGPVIDWETGDAMDFDYVMRGGAVLVGIGLVLLLFKKSN